MTNENNRIVQGLWIGGRLTELERLCIRSFCANGHEFHLYRYDDLGQLPKVGGLRLMDGEDILPRAAIFRGRKDGSFMFFADHFRFELLRQRGGWWVDMDIVCMRPLDIAEDVAFVRDARPNHILSGVLKFPRGHFFAAAIADACANINRIQPWDSLRVMRKKTKRRLLFWRDSRRHISAYDAAGMRGLFLAVRHFGMEKYALPVSSWLLPGNPQAHKFVESLGRDWNAVLCGMPQLRFIHLDNRGFSLSAINKDGGYPADCLYEVLKRRYPEREQ